MKKNIAVAVLLLGLFVCLSLGAQENDQSTYSLVVVDRANCRGATVQIDVPLAVIAHGDTGYYIVIGKGNYTPPSGGVVRYEVSSKNPSVIYDALDAPSFRRYVTSTRVLDGLKFTVQQAKK